MPRPPAAHGTNAAYLAHRRRGEEACEECKTAHAATEGARREQGGSTPRQRGPAHGTRAAYERERRAFAAGKGREPCEECRTANRERTTNRRATPATVVPATAETAVAAPAQVSSPVVVSNESGE